MNSPAQPQQFLHSLEKVVQTRHQIATHLTQMGQMLTQAESESETCSGAFGWENIIEDIESAGRRLNSGVFRLLVLGDMKRGKSTFLNALIGDNLLPSDVNPCTALLTILRYGEEKRVTVHFVSDRAPRILSFDEFRQNYTIDPSEAKQLEASQELAFPEVSHAVVEYPLEILKKGVEIVDSPGLNDTESRNELSLGYIQNCHAILFVLRATQPCTLAERRYLDNYIKDRGLTTFFLINAWDQIKESLLDPDDEAEVAAAKARLDKVFRANLQEYTNQDGYDLYEERVFPISALQALRDRIKNPDSDLAGSGMPEFMEALNTFLTQERVIAEFRQARTMARQVSGEVSESINLRVPLLTQSLQELQGRIDAVQPEFDKLSDIGERFREEIHRTRDRQARGIADSFKSYVLDLPRTFDEDFTKYQPGNIGFLDYFSHGQREAFEKAFEKAFESYLKDKISSWVGQAEKDLEVGLKYLRTVADEYGQSYQLVTDEITQKLTGESFKAPSKDPDDPNTPGWARWAMGLYSVATGNFAGATLAMGGFDFNTIFINLIAALGVSFLASVIFGVMLGPITFALVGLGLGALQVEQGRNQFVQLTKKEFAKHLPKLAEEQWQPIHSTVQDSFDKYEEEVMSRLNGDIKSRRAELDNLVSQKQDKEIDCHHETSRLRQLQQNIEQETESVDSLFRSFLA